MPNSTSNGWINYPLTIDVPAVRATLHRRRIRPIDECQLSLQAEYARVQRERERSAPQMFVDFMPVAEKIQYTTNHRTVCIQEIDLGAYSSSCRVIPLCRVGRFRQIGIGMNQITLVLIIFYGWDGPAKTIYFSQTWTRDRERLPQDRLILQQFDQMVAQELSRLREALIAHPAGSETALSLPLSTTFPSQFESIVYRE